MTFDLRVTWLPGLAMCLAILTPYAASCQEPPVPFRPRFSAGRSAICLEGTPSTLVMPADIAVICGESMDPEFTGRPSTVCTQPPEPTRATDLFISEYVEGSANNKYLEIFNGTGASVDLGAYGVVVYANGGTAPGPSISLSGILADGATYVIANTGAILWPGIPNKLSGSLNFNGDDAVALRRQQSDIDVLGVIGDSAKFAENVTLVRRDTVNSPRIEYRADEWGVSAIDTVDGLGSHGLAEGPAGGLYFALDSERVEAAGFCGDEFAIVRRWTAEDACGARVTRDQIITVESPPSVAHLADRHVTVPPGVQGAVVVFPPEYSFTATDACHAESTPLFLEPPSGSTFPLGATLVTATSVLDACGRAVTGTFAIVVQEAIPGITLGSLNLQNYGQNSPKTNTVQADRKRYVREERHAQFMVNLLQEIDPTNTANKTTDEIAAIVRALVNEVTPGFDVNTGALEGNYTNCFSGLKGPDVDEREAYAFIFDRDHLPAEFVDVENLAADIDPEMNQWFVRPPSAIRLAVGPRNVWLLSFHARPNTGRVAVVDAEITNMAPIIAYFHTHPAPAPGSSNLVIVGGDWNREFRTDAGTVTTGFRVLVAGGMADGEPDTGTTVNNLGAVSQSRFDHFVWGPRFQGASVINGQRDDIRVAPPVREGYDTLISWKTNISDHLGVSCRIIEE